MTDNARKYNLNAGEIKSHGISACTTSNQFSLLSNFTIGNCNYSQITTDDLSQMSKPNYLKRVCDFLNYLNIEDGRIRENLIEDASYYDPACNVLCKLNSDFLVYRFLEGVRIVNIGDVKGEAQYRAYPMGDNPTGYTWQTSATFLNVDLNKIYVFEVRDFFENEEYCKVQRTVSLPILVQSTTFVPEEKQIYLNQKACGSSGIAYFNNGTVEIDPLLTSDEVVSVNYTLFADAYGSAQSCAQLFCKPNNCNTYLNYKCHIDIQGTTTGTFILCAGDKMCYNLNTVVPSAGSCGCSCFEINSVNGGGTTLPSIDPSRCCEARSACIPRENITVSLTESTIYTNNCCEKKNGVFEFTPSIIENNCMTIELDGLASTTSAMIGNSANIAIKCKPDGGTSYDTIILHSDNNPQPLIENIIARHGDSLCYEIESRASAGQTSSSCITISDVFSSNGITSSIGSPNSICVENEPEAPPVTVSMCKQNTICNDGCSCGCGYINVDPLLAMNECVKINFNAELYVSDDGNPNIQNQARAAIQCKGENDFTHVSKCFMIQQSSGSQSISGELYARPNDSICYCVLTYNPNVTVALSCLSLTSVTGFNGVNANINSSKCDHCVDSISEIYGYPSINSPIGINNL